MPDRDDKKDDREATTDWDISEPSLRALRERYDLLEELGRGVIGPVYRARDRETGNTVALKVLWPGFSNDSKFIERFEAELRLARKFTHKNVCRVYDLSRFGNVAAISIEYLEGKSLREFLNSYGAAPFRKGLEWAGQICSALVEAHTHGIIHGDLKPDNILIDQRGQVKVMGFGIALSTAKTGPIFGTPGYMSPEEIKGKPRDARSDIYSLGLVLYEMFTGQRAFQAESAAGFILKQIQESPRPPRQLAPTLPSHIEEAILKCLEKDPAERFQSVAMLQAALGKEEAGACQEAS
ncbi:MAG: serine/threonine protein kinase [Terriglobia bacterium]